MQTERVTELDQLQIGREYLAEFDEETGRPVLVRPITRGRPRGLNGDQLAAARALRRLEVSFTTIAEILGVTKTAVRTAVGRS